MRESIQQQINVFFTKYTKLSRQLGVLRRFEIRAEEVSGFEVDSESHILIEMAWAGKVWGIIK